MAINRETKLTKLPYRIYGQMTRLLDPGDEWKQLIEVLPERYDVTDVAMFASVGRRPNQSATQSLLSDWATQNTTLGSLIEKLVEAKLYRAADYLCIDILHGDPAPRLPQDKGTIVIQNPNNTCVVTEELPSPKPPPVSSESQNIYNRHDHVPSVTPSRLPVETNCSESQNIYNRHDLASSASSPYLPVDTNSTNTLHLSKTNTQRTVEKPASIMSENVGDINNQVTLRIRPPTPSDAVEQDGIADFPLNFTSDVPLQIRYNLLKSITKGFNDAPHTEGGNFLGKGGFGSVYLGTLQNGKKLAVKRLQEKDQNVEKQFLTEVEVLSKYRHINLLPLTGYSDNGPYNCIVYEFMSNGSLEQRLQCEGGSSPLPVSLRLSIAKETARGICHLHTFGEKPLVHRDIKSANVLLDDNMTAKVGDFGFARIGSHGNNKSTAIIVSSAIGTSAYMAPECLRFDVSVKLDSFSYGVVLLELLTGLESLDMNRPEPDLASHVMENCEDIEEMLDEKVAEWSHDMARNMYDIACRCLESMKKKRPTMVEILPDIEKLTL